jgi:hypothetical protein
MTGQPVLPPELLPELPPPLEPDPLLELELLPELDPLPELELLPELDPLPELELLPELDPLLELELPPALDPLLDPAPPLEAPPLDPAPLLDVDTGVAASSWPPASCRAAPPSSVPTPVPPSAGSTKTRSGIEAQAIQPAPSAGTTANVNARRRDATKLGLADLIS